VWEAATGQQPLALKGHSGTVSRVAFSPDGKHLLSADSDGGQLLWELSSGKLLPGAQIHGAIRGPRSPDRRHLARVHGSVIWLHRLAEDTAEERARQRRWVEPDFAWHAVQARQAQVAGQWFAAAFHLGRLLPSRPWDAGLHLDRACALARLGQAGPAAAHYLRALFLNPHVRLSHDGPRGLPLTVPRAAD